MAYGLKSELDCGTPVGVLAGLGDCCNVEVRIRGGLADPDGEGIADTLGTAAGTASPGLLLICATDGRDGLQDGVRGDGAFILGCEAEEERCW